MSASQLPLFDLPEIPRAESDPELPESLRELLAAGFPGEAVGPLLERLGGRVIAVAEHPREGSELVEVVGLWAAQVMGRVLGGTPWSVPRGEGLRRAVRDRAIRRDYDAGTAVRFLVRNYALTERQIRKILSRP